MGYPMAILGNTVGPAESRKPGPGRGQSLWVPPAPSTSPLLGSETPGASDSASLPLPRSPAHVRFSDPCPGGPEGLTQWGVCRGLSREQRGTQNGLPQTRKLQQPPPLFTSENGLLSSYLH